MNNDENKQHSPMENNTQSNLPKGNSTKNNNLSSQPINPGTASVRPINNVPGTKHTPGFENTTPPTLNNGISGKKFDNKTNDTSTTPSAPTLPKNQELPAHDINEKTSPKPSKEPSSQQIGNSKGTDKKKPLNKSTKSPQNKDSQKKIGIKNPTKNLPAKKKYSKHAKNDEDNASENDSEQKKTSLPTEGLKRGLTNRLLNRRGSSQETTENESEEVTGQQVLGALGGTFKKIIGIIAGFVGMTPFAISGLLIALLIIVIAVVIVPIISSLSFYGEDDDGTVCFVASPCTSVVIKDGDTEKTYALDEYIAGAMVKNYKYSTLAKFSVFGSTVDDNLLKALAVIIHSDLATYALYDGDTETCTIESDMKFNSVYEPPKEADSNTGDTTDGSNDVGDEEVDAASGASSEDNGTSTDDNQENNIEETDEEETEKKYYEQAKQAADSVISEVVDIYNEDIDLFYSNYIKVLHDAVDAKKDYKGIVRAYIKNSPDYSSTDDDVSDDDDNDDSDNSTSDENSSSSTTNKIGVYPICHFDINRSSSEKTYYSDDICSTVEVNDKYSHGEIYSGTYTIDDFIAGTVYAEARAWYRTPEMMKAQAVAARTYLVNRARVENGTCYITTSTSTMSFTKNTIPEIDAAVKETSGEYIMVNGEISKEAEWDALRVVGTSGSNYIIAQKNQLVPKAWLDAPGRLFNSIEWYNRYSHGRGMSQYGAYYLASEQNKTYKEIINYYYDGDVSVIAKTSKNGYIIPLNTFSYISGETTGRCGNKKVHGGLDLVAPKGTPVYAAHSGTVVDIYDTNYQCPDADNGCGDTRKNAGLGVEIDNGDGTYSGYMHFSSIENLKIGQTIEAGQKLGEVGNTGHTYPIGRGFHLHYQMKLVTKNSKGKVIQKTTINPRDYLPLDEKGYGVCYNYR